MGFFWTKGLGEELKLDPEQAWIGKTMLAAKTIKVRTFQGQAAFYFTPEVLESQIISGTVQRVSKETVSLLIDGKLEHFERDRSQPGGIRVIEVF